MGEDKTVKPLSKALADPLVKAYTAGRYGLVGVFVGTLLLVSAVFSEPGASRYLLGAFGALFILAVLALFYFYHLKRVQAVSEQIHRNQELLDTMQATAVQLTDLVDHLQALALTHADGAASLVTLLRQRVKDITGIPLLANLPGVEHVRKLADHPYVVKAEALSHSIATTTVAGKNVIENLRTAIMASDPELLKTCMRQLHQLDEEAKKLLKK